MNKSRDFCRIPEHLDSKGERPGGPCDPDCEWVSGRPHWNFKERLVFLDCSDGCLGSCLVILALPASECSLGASESGSVMLGRLRTAAWHALDFQKAHVRSAGAHRRCVSQVNIWCMYSTNDPGACTLIRGGLDPSRC